MDTGLTIRPNSGATQVGAGRGDVIPTQTTPPTELAPSKAVVESAASEKTQAEPGSPSRQMAEQRNAAAQASLNVESQVILDPASREVIFRMIDVRTRRVVQQVPEQALLRLRAYTRALESGESVARVMVQADLAT